MKGRLLCALCVVISLVFTPLSLTADTIRVAAAASLSHVLPEIAAEFERASGHAVKISPGSSGNLTQQIRHGAPFAIFMSADEHYVALLEEEGHVQGAAAVYALGRLSLYAPNKSEVDVGDGVKGVAESLKKGAIKRFAIASPEHAPYGKMARNALQRAGLWGAIETKLIVGENAAQTAQFAVTGLVDAALIPRSLALLPAVAERGRSEVLPQALAPALSQRMALTANADDAARQFFTYLQTEPARRIFKRHGFSVPE